MRILITNDDGINAKGIYELSKKINELAEVIIVAPSHEKSATSHSITVHNPIRVKEKNFMIYR